MIKLLKIFFRADPRALITLFFVVTFAITGVLTISQLVENVKQVVATEARPYLGADVAIIANATYSGVIQEEVLPLIANETGYKLGEKIEFFTTLFDLKGQTGLVRVVAVDETYPMYSTFVTKPIIESENRVYANQELIDRFGKNIKLDQLTLDITDVITETSEIGAGFGDEGFILIVPRSLLAGTELLSKGSRLQRKVLIQSVDDAQTDRIYTALRPLEQGRKLDVDSYITNAKRTNEAVDELSRYTLLIIAVCLALGGITLLSSMEGYFAKLRPVFGVGALLGFTSRRQAELLSFTFFSVILLAGLTAIGISYGVVEAVKTFPEASEFTFQSGPILFSLQTVGVVIIAIFAPLLISFIKESPLERLKPKVSNTRDASYLVGAICIATVYVAYIILGNILLTLGVLGGGVVIVGILFYIILFGFRSLFKKTQGIRKKHFGTFDGIRGLVRPGMPSGGVTLLLFLSLSLIFVFISMTLTFRDKLQISVDDTVNIYAMNVLESDVEAVRENFPDDKIFSIMRARIVGINGMTLSGFLNTERPGGEFSREFNVTSSVLDTKIIRGVQDITKEGVSVDDEFAQRIGIDLGDVVKFSISGREFELTVENVRARSSRGFQPFFYFQISDTAFANAPKTYFLSTFAESTDIFKKKFLSVTGPHISFVDVGEVLDLVKSIAQKILAVLSLFLFFVTIFAVLAIATLFARAEGFFQIKKTLYSLLGASESLTKAARFTGIIIPLGTALVVSVGLGTIGLVWLFSNTSFLSFSWIAFGYGLIAVVILTLSMLLWFSRQYAR